MGIDLKMLVFDFNNLFINKRISSMAKISVKNVVLLFFVFHIIFVCGVRAEENKSEAIERSMVIFSAGRNNARYYKKHLDSIFNQMF